MNELKSKIALITGASRGIGKAIALSLAKEGVSLSIASRDKKSLDEAADEIRKQSSVKILSVPTDVTRQDNLENLVNKTIDEFGKIDILINNAGISSQHPFHKQPLNDIEMLMRTNFFGYVMCTRLVVPHMVKNNGGAIINIVSGSTLVDPPPRNFIVYTSLKWALRAFSKGLFWEMRDHGIKVTSILPGVTDTALTGSLNQSSIEPSRLMTTEAIEKAVIFALTVPANVCPLEISVINQQTPWKVPIIPYQQQHPK